ncbi:MAG TPA: hypothetical protein VLE91_02410 [Candidatus Saccharimonadales bacterium]|nr:hypothetical protein [Candidatus Saccharimonadales bacterium]
MDREPHQNKDIRVGWAYSVSPALGAHVEANGGYFDGVPKLFQKPVRSFLATERGIPRESAVGRLNGTISPRKQ